MNAANGGMLAALRDATASRHAALDRSDWFARTLASRASYEAHIGCVVAFSAAAEAALAPHRDALGALGLWSDDVLRSGALQAEARALNVRVAARVAFPPLERLDDAVGALYVLAGAALGGTLLARRVQGALAWQSAYYAGAGRDTAAGWRRFCGALETSGCDAARAARSACATFDAFCAGVAAAA